LEKPPAFSNPAFGFLFDERDTLFYASGPAKWRKSKAGCRTLAAIIKTGDARREAGHHRGTFVSVFARRPLAAGRGRETLGL